MKNPHHPFDLVDQLQFKLKANKINNLKIDIHLIASLIERFQDTTKFSKFKSIVEGGKGKTLVNLTTTMLTNSKKYNKISSKIQS